MTRAEAPGSEVRTGDEAAAAACPGHPGPAGACPLLDLVERAAAERQAVLERERDEAREALARALDARARLLACVSHELRNPLTSIVLAASVLTSDQLDHAHVDPAAVGERVLADSRSLLAIIDDLLDLTTPGAGRRAQRPVPISVSDLLHEALDDVAALAREHDVVLHRPDVVQVQLRADRGRLRQVLVNLLVNAVKFTPASGHVHVTVACDQDVTISVRDTGIGIDPADQVRIFEPFEQVHPGRGGGVGLGLAICRRILDGMGGRICVESTLGQGSTFRITLPGARALHAVT